MYVVIHTQDTMWQYCTLRTLQVSEMCISQKCEMNNYCSTDMHTFVCIECVGTGHARLVLCINQISA
jgi:hypothetical protein